MDKLEESKIILTDLGIIESEINKVACLTFLALCGFGQNDLWEKVNRRSMTLTKDIMKFVNEEYEQTYAQNTREAFRNDAIKLFLENEIIDLNPDNPKLAPQSSKTHYSLKPILGTIIPQYKTPSWKSQAKKFRESLKFPLVQNLKILNFKSIEDLNIELGRFNVLIGANGSGKSNILEALAMLSASKGNDLDIEGIINRGVRVAKPNLTFSSFLGKQTKKEIEIEFGLKSESEPVNITSKLRCTDNNDIYAKWIDSESKNHSYEHLFNELKSINDVEITKEINNIISNIQKTFNSKSILQVDSKILDKLSEFVIYNLTTQSLRGLSSESKKQPLGINGESLDVLLNNFSKSELELLESHNNFFNWLDGIKIDKRDELKTEGYKLGKSNSKLYFTDKYMLKKNNLFSAENANEGILHVLFYLSLFISQKTPNFFAIDNIETALNPKLCRELVKHLVELSILKNKQAIITTHNPAILDGLNLNDDNQRLFEVYRNDNGATKIRRIKFKSDLSDKQYKISSMWMNGVLGAIPKNF